MPDNLGQFHKTERLEKYVEFNQFTRHQLIVAHLTLVEAREMDRVKLRDALSEGEHNSMDELISFVIDDLAKTN